MGVLFTFLLGICAMYDLRIRTIPAIWIWFSIWSMTGYRAYMIIFEKSSITESIICLLPGILLLLFSRIGRCVGSGDGWLMIAGGLLLEWEQLVAMLFFAFVAAGLFSVGYCIFVKRERNARIPFVPFLLLGLISLFLRGSL